MLIQADGLFLNLFVCFLEALEQIFMSGAASGVNSALLRCWLCCWSNLVLGKQRNAVFLEPLTTFDATLC